MLKYLRKRWIVRDLLRSWGEFRGFVLNALGVVITREEEDRFLALQARIASRLPVLASLVPASIVPDAKEQFGRITELLVRYRTLQTEAPLAPAERAEFENTWHQLFLFLNMIKDTPAARTESEVKLGKAALTGMPRHHVRRVHRPIPGAHFLGFAARLGLFAVFLYLLGRAFGFRFDSAKGFTTAGPPTAQGMVSNVTDGVRSLTGAVAHLLDPVVAAYGGAATYVLVGILLLGVGYWFFVRR